MKLWGRALTGVTEGLPMIQPPPLPPQPPRTKKHSGCLPAVLLLVGALVVIGAIGAAVAGMKPSSTSTPSGGSDSPNTVSSDVAAWARSTQVDANTLLLSINAIQSASQDDDLTGTIAACSSASDSLSPLQDDASTAPTTEIGAAMVRALDAFNQAFESCQGGDLSGAASELVSGSSLLNVATQDVSDYVASR